MRAYLRKILNLVAPMMSLYLRILLNYNFCLIAELRNCAEWLKKWSQPEEVVFENWEKSYELRKCNSANTVEKFLNDWPIILNSSFTSKLVNII